ncbi:hypothetical protein STEG23_034845, partial [Scotinomys teguina]
MDAKVVAVLVLVLAALSISDGKPVSLSYRCPCRFFESHVSRSNVKHLKILNTPNCALQIVARLKSNNRQVCIDPKLKWIQEYLEKALNNKGSKQPAEWGDNIQDGENIGQLHIWQFRTWDCWPRSHGL